MSKKKKHLLDFEIDKLTNSIENAVTGECFMTILLPVSKSDLKTINKKNGWLFDWKSEYQTCANSIGSTEPRQMVKLIAAQSPNIIQGIVSFTIKQAHVEMELIESAPFNRSKNKTYLGVAGNMVAHVCKFSFDSGRQGFVSFLSKTTLIKHYQETLGAVHEHGQLMVLYPDKSMKLVKQYFQL